MRQRFMFLRMQILPVVSLIVMGAWSGIASAQQCVGDCNDDMAVRVNELITGVNINLGNSSIDLCPAFDANGNGSVAINELVTAVNNNLYGCGVTPPTRTFTPTRTETPTLTPTSVPPTATATNPPVSTLDGGVLFGQSCVPCHDNDAGDIDDTSVSALTSAIDDPFTGMDILAGRYSAEELQALSDFMTTVEHSSNWSRPSNHGAYVMAAGVSTCEVCHGGSSLRGDGDAPSCFRCHGMEW